MKLGILTAPFPGGSTVLITEASPNGADEIEFTNVSSSALNLSGWTIHVYDDTTWPVPLSAFTIPAGRICAARTRKPGRLS